MSNGHTLAHAMGRAHVIPVAVVKTAVDEDVVGEGITIQDAETMYQHLMLHHSLPDPDSAPANCVHTTRSYWVIRKEDINTTTGLFLLQC